jgi:hypothetical protein
MALAAHPAPAAQRLEGSLRPRLAAFPRVGDLDPSTPLTLDLSLPLPDAAGLDAFIATLYDPHSPNYRRFLTPREFAGRFGPSPSDYAALAGYVRAHGLEVTATYTSRLLLQARGRADAVERAFHVTLGVRRRGDKTLFFAPDQEASVDVDLPGLKVDGLDNYARRRNHLRRRSRSMPAPSAVPAPARGPRPRLGTGGNSSWGYGYYQGYDFRDAYAVGVPSTLVGKGQAIGLVEFGGFLTGDIQDYLSGSIPPMPAHSFAPASATSPAGTLAAATIYTVLLENYDGLPADNGDSSAGSVNDTGEVSLDIELASAMAPQASIVVYESLYTDPTMADVVAKIAEDDLCSQTSNSWSDADDSASIPILANMAAQGQAFCNASGDDGALDLDNPPGPVGQPDSLSQYITDVGGTNLAPDGGELTPTPSPVYVAASSETVWNDYDGSCHFNGVFNGYGGASSGGICSGDPTDTVDYPSLALPSYQVGVANGSNGASSSFRNIPDVAADAESFWVVDSYGAQTGPFDGTSGASPLWAAFLALVNQQALAENRAPLGFANVALYQLAESSNYASLFTDITQGDNGIVSTPGNFSCDAVFYTAGSGYDLCTGWGSPKGMALINALVGTIPSPTPTISPSFSISPTFTISNTFTASPTISATPTITATASPSATPTVSPSDTETATITDTASDSPTATRTATASPSPSVTPSSTQSGTATHSPTITPTPAYLSSGLGRSILAPVPARGGEAVTLFFSAQPQRSQWSVYNVAGELVARVDQWGEGPHQLSTRGLASGIYLAHIRVDYADGSSQTFTQKFVVIR